MPEEVTRAQALIGLCDRFHCLPSQLMDEPVEIIQLLALAALGEPEGGSDG